MKAFCKQGNYSSQLVMIQGGIFRSPTNGHPQFEHREVHRDQHEADSHQDETVRLLASETIITVSGNMESSLNITSVLHRLLQVLVLIYLPNIKDPVLVKVNH